MHAVYIHRDANDKPLYVGCSGNLTQRNTTHKSASSWFCDVANINVEFFGRLDEALRAEKELIKTLQPPYNQQHNPAVPKVSRKWPDNTGHLFLDDWFSWSGATAKDFAAAISAPTCTVKKMRSQVCHPHVRRRVLIAVATSGYVPECAWEFREVLPFEGKLSESKAASFFARAEGLCRSWSNLEWSEDRAKKWRAELQAVASFREGLSAQGVQS